MTSEALASTAIPIEIGCFRPGPEVFIEGVATGPLAGLRFAAKDLFDVAGFVTGGGNPSWFATHTPADTTAPVIRQLIDNGATLVGKTMTDDLACGMFGENPALRHTSKSALSRPRPGRLLERLGICGRGGARRLRDRHRHRGQHPRPGVVLRDLRLSTFARPGEPQRLHSDGAELRYLRLAGARSAHAVEGRRCAAAGRRRSRAVRIRDGVRHAGARRARSSRALYSAFRKARHIEYRSPSRRSRAGCGGQGILAADEPTVVEQQWGMVRTRAPRAGAGTCGALHPGLARNGGRLSACRCGASSTDARARRAPARRPDRPFPHHSCAAAAPQFLIRSADELS